MCVKDCAMEHSCVVYCLWALHRCVASNAGMRSIEPELRNGFHDTALKSQCFHHQMWAVIACTIHAAGMWRA